MLDLKADKLYDSVKEDEGKTFRVLQVLGINEDLWDRVRGLGELYCKQCWIRTDLFVWSFLF